LKTKGEAAPLLKENGMLVEEDDGERTTNYRSAVIKRPTVQEFDKVEGIGEKMKDLELPKEELEVVKNKVPIKNTPTAMAEQKLQEEEVREE